VRKYIIVENDNGDSERFYEYLQSIFVYLHRDLLPRLNLVKKFNDENISLPFHKLIFVRTYEIILNVVLG
jgi:hypothetical protein